MLKEAMLALRVTDMEYAPDICRLLKSAETDLKMAGVVISGTCVFVISEDVQTGAVTVADNSTITDDAVQTAMITYVGARGSYAGNEERDRLEKSYDLQRRQLANATGYTDFGEEETGGDPSTAPGGSAQDDTVGATEDPSAAPQDDAEGAEDA